MDIVTYALLLKKLGSKANLVDGKVPASELPSYVDDVIEYASVSDFPAEGERSKIYVALDTGFTYRWSGSEYIQIGGQDLSDYYTKTETNQLLDNYATSSDLTAGLATKQDQLTTSSIPDGDVDKVIGFNTSNVLNKEQLSSFTSQEMLDLLQNAGRITEFITINDDPMSFGIVGGAQKSAVGDGNASLNKLVCVDVVKNQLLDKTYFESNKSGNNVTFTNNGDGSITINGTIDEGMTLAFYLDAMGHDVTFINGHKYLVWALANGVSGLSIRMFYTETTPIEYDILTTDNCVTQIKTFTKTSGTWRPYLVVADNTTTFSNLKIKPYIIDLTQRYGNNDVVNAIIGTGTDAEKVARLLAFDPEILNDIDYDAGTLVPSKTAKLKTVNYNQLSPNAWINATGIGSDGIYYGAGGSYTAYKTSAFTRIKSGHVYRLLKLSSYKLWYCLYDAKFNPITSRFDFEYVDYQQFIAPINAMYVKVMLLLASDQSNLCLFDFWDGSRIGFEPYQEHIVTLPNYEGHGILKVVDGNVVADGTELYPDGNSKKRYVKVKLGDLTFTKVSNATIAGTFNAVLPYSNAPDGMSQDNVWVIAIISYGYSYGWKANVQMDDKTFRVAGDALRICDSAFNNSTGDQVKAILGDVYLVYELATEEDITTPTYQSTFPVEQGGTLQFLDENNNPIAGLQGSEIKYEKAAVNE